MKKLAAITLTVICLFLSVCPALSALASGIEEPASGGKEPSNVTITVVIPDTAGDDTKPDIADDVESDTPTAPADLPVSSSKPVCEPACTAPPAPAISKVYPSDVTDIRDGGGWQIVKTYELSANEKPEDIPRDGFERSGWRFTLTDIIRHETASAETREHTETVTLNTDTKELETILPLFSPTMEYKADDGYVGIITLDVSSIKVETAGTKTSSYTMSVTREYPHLSANDTGLVPKTVTDRGTTYTLAGVDWRAGNYVTIDYEQVPEYYTAVATYTATGTSTKVTGYVTTAVYTGTLAKLSQGKTIYTAYFLGEEIRTPLDMVTPTPSPVAAPSPSATTTATATPTPEPSGEPSPSPSQSPESTVTPAPASTPEPPQKGGEPTNPAKGALLAAVPIAGLLLGGAYYFIKRKGTQNAKNHNNGSDAAGDSGDGGSGSGR